MCTSSSVPDPYLGTVSGEPGPRGDVRRPRCTGPDLINSNTRQYGQTITASAGSQLVGSNLGQQPDQSTESFSDADQVCISGLLEDEDMHTSSLARGMNFGMVHSSIKQEPQTGDYSLAESCGSPASSNHEDNSHLQFEDHLYRSMTSDSAEAVVGGSYGSSHAEELGASLAALCDPIKLYPQALAPGGISSRIRRFACHLCDKQFLSRNHLQRHILVHTGEKPYKCEVCGLACNQKSNLKKHMLVHTDCAKLHQCHLCPNSFTQRSHLNMHLQTHNVFSV
jgi:hypothetical protein